MVQMPQLSRRTRQIVSTVATVALLLAVWWLQNRGADDDSAARGRDDVSSASTPDTDSDGFRYVAVDQLPPEAGETLELIDDGGPYPYPGKDGSTFGNFEGVLPDRQRGYYAEYTVETPGLSHRGARRIIAGDGGEFYWTEDHYESFERISR
ncbi:ribonuclease domain-containing protein [Nocardioides sp. WS12]|uniref:ribonuclease domain-containing protein n=1 Tax=Nocardioides sp. WS12 TaxID=2486272 RepID=UPI001F433D6C|nr:ribonuclease domain-containing protein [Nocardioides sp. WS12]